MDGDQALRAKIKIEHRLPFVQIVIWYKGQRLLLEKVLVDTGSASTILKLDLIEEIGITAEETDIVGSISGVGGSEYVFLKKIDCIEIAGVNVKDVIVDVGAMNYGIDIHGIIGTDLLLKINGVINLKDLVLESNLGEA